MDHFVAEYCVVILGACEHSKMMLRGWADDGAELNMDGLC